MPSDYGKNVAPRRGKTPFVSVVSIEASPTGDIIAAVAGNQKDQELDIILISAKDGQYLRNLTSGFDQSRGWEYIATSGGMRGNLVPWISWAPVGDRVAYFVRTEKQKSLIIQNVVSGRVEQRIEMKTLDMPESPAFSPDGKRVAFSAMAAAVADIYVIDLASPIEADAGQSDGELVFRAGEFVSRIPAASAAALDVRDKAELAALRGARRRDVILWRVALGAVAALLVLGLGEFALVGGRQWLKVPQKRHRGAEPRALVAFAALADGLEQFGVL